MYRVIMVPVDGSAFSREAVFQGLRLAEKKGAQLRLVRVGSMPIVVGSPETAVLESKAWGTERDSMLTQLYRLAAECRANAHVDVTATLEDGPVADALRGHALRHSVGLIVMATHARRGIARVWLGSVADRLIRETGIPVLTVRPPSLATELSSGSCYKRIIVALDGSPLAEKSLKPALALARVEEAEITLLRIVPSERDIPMGELHSTIGPARARDVNQAENYLAGLKVMLAEHRTPIHSAVVVAVDIPTAILGFAETHDADLIAIATHGRGGLARAMIGSVADRVMTEGGISALILHPFNLAPAGIAAEAPSDFALAPG
ncbi:MAG TPA: universal stress protein [Gemmatimonadaceae bacterium]